MVTVKYDDLQEAFDFVSFAAPFEHSAFVSLDTGRIYWVSEAIPDEEELPEDLESSDRYLAIPHKNDLDLGQRLVLRFAEEHLAHRYSDLAACFRRRGAYGRLKEIFTAERCLDQWYAFEAEHTKQALRAWCAAHEIEVID